MVEIRSGGNARVCTLTEMRYRSAAVATGMDAALAPLAVLSPSDGHPFFKSGVMSYSNDTAMFQVTLEMT